MGRHHGRRHTVAHVDPRQLLLFLAGLHDVHVAVLIAHVNLAVDDHRRTPDGC